MNPDEEDPRPAPEEPTPEGSDEPIASAERSSPAEATSDEPPAEMPPSVESLETHEIAPPPQAAPTPEPELVAPPPAPAPILREPLVPAYDPHSANPLDEPMSDDAFAQRRDYDDPAESLFGTPEPQPDIRFPGEGRARGPRVRDAQANLDLDLGRIKRRKRYGLLLTTLSVFFVALILAPVTWALAYLFFDPPSTVLMLQRASEGQAIHHAPVPLNRISPYLIRSVIAAEDSNFCTHHGFDVNAIQDALESNAEGNRMRGGSTISQQTAKNLFLWPQRSWVRKGFETYFTALIEFMWPKHRIMEAYLNSAEWGDGNFGAEAAARARFGVSAADLSPLQAARLAAVLPSPNRWRADSPGPYVRRRAASVVERAQVVRNNHMASCVLMIDAPQ
ncbi:MAG: monofunctional biosynthetic peptidoglycan transglycosylase [Vitreimonas sp.]